MSEIIKIGTTLLLLILGFSCLKIAFNNYCPCPIDYPGSSDSFLASMVALFDISAAVMVYFN
jgi:hypothetical protein